MYKFNFMLGIYVGKIQFCTLWDFKHPLESWNISFFVFHVRTDEQKIENPSEIVIELRNKQKYKVTSLKAGRTKTRRLLFKRECLGIDLGPNKIWICTKTTHTFSNCISTLCISAVNLPSFFKMAISNILQKSKAPFFIIQNQGFWMVYLSSLQHPIFKFLQRLQESNRALIATYGPYKMTARKMFLNLILFGWTHTVSVGPMQINSELFQLFAISLKI